MTEILEPLSTVVPSKYAGQLAFLLVASQVLGRMFHALRTGGGLKGLFASIWLGTNTPRANPPASEDKRQQRLFGLTLAAVPMLLVCGCAQFTTTQTDQSYEDGKPIRQITTRATATTFFESKSALASFKASQTDKTQSATVGSLNQESGGTNTAATVQAVTELLRTLR